MKKQILVIAALGILGISQAQDIPQSQVPSVIINEFNSRFTKATDVEWEMEGELYAVDFEIGWGQDHEVWYNTEGKIVRHKEDISSNDLPKAVKDRVETDFSGLSMEDLKRITDEGKVVYKMELNSLMEQDWEVVIDEDGTILSKIAD